MSERMKMISAIGLAAMAGLGTGQADIPREYEPAKESAAHRKLRLKRRIKRHMQRKSRKANRL